MENKDARNDQDNESDVTPKPSPSAVPAQNHSNSVHKKHPLQNTWCLWIYTPTSKTQHKDNWFASQTKVHEFNTVEDFWCLQNNIHGPSKIGIADYSMFKRGIIPAWEDEKCKHGGRWIAKFDKIRHERLDEIWLNVVLAMIGENFDEEGFDDNICGAVVSSRAKGCKVALWISARDEKRAVSIGRAYHKLLLPLVDSKKDADVAFEDFSTNAQTFTVRDEDK